MLKLSILPVNLIVQLCSFQSRVRNGKRKTIYMTLTLQLEILIVPISQLASVSSYEIELEGRIEVILLLWVL